MRAFEKDFFRGLRKNKGKFISVFFIILLGAAFFSGLRSSESDMLLSAEAYYDASALMDQQVVGTAGLTEADLADIRALDAVENAVGVYTLDVLCNTEERRAVKLISISDEINLPTVTEGRLPQRDDECLLDALLLELGTYRVGDPISFLSGSADGLEKDLAASTFTVVGFCNLPQYMDLNRGSGNVGNGEIDGFVLLREGAFLQSVYTQINVTLRGAKELDSFEQEYEALAEQGQSALLSLADAACSRRYAELAEQFAGQPVTDEQLASLIPAPEWYVLGRDAIFSCRNYRSDAERVASLGKLLPIIFFLVAALVSLTAMTRMVEEERQQIGTLKALGCGDGTVMFRYLCYALLPALTGSVLGVLVGEKVFPLAIMRSYSLLYAGLTSYVLPYNILQGAIAVLASILCTGLATVWACLAVTREKPAQIMRPESPKPGKRVLLERVPFFWKHLSFTQKSTVRNMFRYKKRFLMTVIGVAGCMGLLLVGLGLHDSIMVVADKQFTEITHYQASVTVSESVSDKERTALSDALSEEYPAVDVFVLYQKSVDAQGAGGAQTLTLCVPAQTEGIADCFTFRTRRSHAPVAFPQSGAIVSEKTAKTMGVSIGDTVTFRDGNSASVSVRIEGIFENYIGHYLFVSADTYRELFGKQPAFNQFLLRYEDDSDAFQDALGNTLLSHDSVQAVSFVSTTVDWADDTLSSLNTIVLIVLGAAALLACVVLYNLNSINIAERKRELATLKVLGFFDGEVAAYIYKENVLLTLIGIVFGLGVGVILHQYVIRSIEVDLIMFGRAITWLSYIGGALLTLAFSLLINLAMYRSLKRIDMIESLKSIE